MTLPPPQGPYGSQPTGGGPQWGGPPPQGPGPQPQYGQPGAPWVQQPNWGAPPPNKGGKGKWILVGLALVAIIAVSIVGTVLVLRPDSSGTSGDTSNTASEFASAKDTGPANIITEDPTCDAWRKVSNELTAVSDAVKWNELDYSVPAAEWTPEQRAAFEKESAALTDVIPSVANLAKQTPHRVMRELYGQVNAYAQAVVDAIPTYSSTDNQIVAASNKMFGALNRVCDAIYFRAAQQTAPLIAAPSPPSVRQAPNEDGEQIPERFLNNSTAGCSDWIDLVEWFDKDKDSIAWGDLDANVKAAEWTPEHKAVMDAVAPVLSRYADDMEHVGRDSGNPIWEDFAIFAAQYMRAYVQGIPTYTPNSVYMSLTSNTLSNGIYWACKAAS
ncbi:hypothetical protein [Mycolicibacterium nivoides]|uniref:Uncharacterized protein n=1 Tax=Mycolicibacterium nivoides TaxID=2487344 RepID=A0ABW9LDT9_9MYCO|nr:hypothetical protein [Mycolicibacterium nivoides]MBN3511643.1 hypothetical protein [Mycolicibacterium septicum]SEQ96994.1 hypothetical protein SAMN04488583_3809 [Mycobacterium sp. 88mf]SFF94940.1 hypothetical protein SAMN04488582_104856 [Mycobacterium sp. 455mf]